MAKFETVPIGELKHRLPAKLLPLVEEYKDKLAKLSADQGARLNAREGRRREGPPEGSQGRCRVSESQDPVPVPWGGGIAELLPRGATRQTGSAAERRRRSCRRRGVEAQAGKTEEGYVVAV